MKKVYRRAWLGLLGLLWMAGSAHASHVIGGNIVLVPKEPANGIFTVCLILYYDANSSDPNADQNTLNVSFFRKKDNVRLNDLLLTQVSREPLPFTNPGCADSRNLKINVVKFAADIQLSPAQYNDPAGYYISWERCCRSSDISNLSSAGISSLVLYAEFPPVTLANHSPVFRTANGEILCRNKPYTFQSGASDADGDELRYRLETPLNSTRPPYGIDPLATSTPGPYPKSEWENGFSATNPLPSTPAFVLDPATGNISLTPSKTGLFAYRIVAEEYRNGRKIGEVHRDYQLLVVDCPNDNPPPVSLTEALYPPSTSITEGDSLIEVGMCQGDTLSLKADPDPQFAYQWQRDGMNIESARGPAFSITQAGVYSVVKTFAKRCGTTSTLGEKFEVKFRVPAKVEITPGPKASVCEGVAIELKTDATGPGWQFTWQKDGTVLDGVTYSLLPGVREAGEYIVKATDIVTRCVSTDTVRVSVTPAPAATIAAPLRELCEGDTVLLQANQGPNLAYTWYQGGFPQPTPIGPTNLVRTEGLYSVQVQDTTTGCLQRSDSIRIKVTPVPKVLFDSIPALCGQLDTRLPLVATPGGGVFSGAGVTGTTFDARQAGAGSHSILYTYTTPGGCVVKKMQLVQVVSAPRAFVGGKKVILLGDSVLLRSSVTEGASYEWSPTLGLSSPSLSQPVASPAQTTTYTLRVSMANGCFAESEVVVEVLPPIKIPNGFTPNGDGTNDTWEIENSSFYENFEVTIFNRWGNKVFNTDHYGNDWNGRFNNELLPAATYYYVIKPHPDLPVRSGSVTLFR